jgi:hypothetical protein
VKWAAISHVRALDACGAGVRGDPFAPRNLTTEEANLAGESVTDPDPVTLVSVRLGGRFDLGERVGLGYVLWFVLLKLKEES